MRTKSLAVIPLIKLLIGCTEAGKMDD